MVWLLATADGEDAGAAVGLVGWHSPAADVARPTPGRFPGARGRGVGTRCTRSSRAGAPTRGCSAMDTEVDRGRRGEPGLGRAPRLPRGRPRLVARARPRARSSRRPCEPPAGIEIVTWAERPGIDRDLYEVYVEAEPDIPGEEHNELPPFEQWLSNDMHGISDRPEAVFVALAGDEVVGYAKLAFPQRGDARVPRPDRRQARLAQARDRGRAQARRRSPGRRRTATRSS